MENTISKTQLLTELHSEIAEWQALLDAIGEANMTQPEVAGGWSIKDIVAHLTGWRTRTVRRLQSILKRQPGFTPPWPPELQEDDEINDWIYESNRNRPLADVLNDSRTVLQQLVDTINAFPDSEFQNPQNFKWLEGNPMNGKFLFAHYHEEHEPDMRSWLNRIKDQTHPG